MDHESVLVSYLRKFWDIVPMYAQSSEIIIHFAFPPDLCCCLWPIIQTLHN